MTYLAWITIAIAALASAAPGNAQSLKSFELPPSYEDPSQDELTVRRGIYDAVDKAVKARDFAALNKMAEDYRLHRSRTPSGTWKLAYFYYGLAGAFYVKPDDVGCVNGALPFVREWIAFDPKQPAPYIAEASSYIRYAGCLRGGDWANNIPAAVLVRVAELAQQAVQMLVDSHEAASVDPQYYATLIDAKRLAGSGRSGLKELLDEATAREPYYYHIYFNTAYTLMPRWYGQPGDLEQLAQYAAEKTSAEDGLGIYARLARILKGAPSEDHKLLNLSKVRAGMEDVVDRYRNDWNTAYSADLACDMGDFQLYMSFMDRTSRKFFPPDWNLTGAKWDGCLRMYQAQH